MMMNGKNGEFEYILSVPGRNLQEIWNINTVNRRTNVSKYLFLLTKKQISMSMDLVDFFLNKYKSDLMRIKVTI